MASLQKKGDSYVCVHGSGVASKPREIGTNNTRDMGFAVEWPKTFGGINSKPLFRSLTCRGFCGHSDCYDEP